MRTLNGAVTVDDPRNDLLLEFLRFVEALKPRTVMMENVPGLADDERFGVFAQEWKSSAMGDHRILNAAEYGVPQRRRRLIYLAGLRRGNSFRKPCTQKRKPSRTLSETCPRQVKAAIRFMTCPKSAHRESWN
jgi:DNA (cytosine-5)-methyltransferase 1